LESAFRANGMVACTHQDAAMAQSDAQGAIATIHHHGPRRWLLPAAV